MHSVNTYHMTGYPLRNFRYILRHLWCMLHGTRYWPWLKPSIAVVNKRTGCPEQGQRFHSPIYPSLGFLSFFCWWVTFFKLPGLLNKTLNWGTTRKQSARLNRSSLRLNVALYPSHSRVTTQTSVFLCNQLLSHPSILVMTLCFCTGSYAAVAASATGRRRLFTR